ncbi:MAG: type VI secretion system baseplate subunit TssF [Deltaproteobacteria bacterium]|nr:type VI secretion system baseplate subunit TssF [Deltaproteobacteria bacterium]
MIPYTQRAFPGFLLLFEYFCFPEKFLFFDLGGLDKIKHPDFKDILEQECQIESCDQ